MTVERPAQLEGSPRSVRLRGLTGRVERTRSNTFATAVGLIVYAVGLSVNQELMVAVAVVALAVTAFRVPFMGPLAVLILAGMYGRTGAYGGVGSFGVPGFEIVLASACVGAGFWLVGKPSILKRSQFNFALVWGLGAVWGVALIFTSRQADLLSRVREAMIFVYPVMIALPLLTLDRRDARRIERLFPYLLVGLGWLVMVAGLYNLGMSTAFVTNTGQNRYLDGSFALPLVGSFYAAIFLYRLGRWSLRATLAGAFPVAGLILVNHRSAFIALVISGLVFSLSQRKSRSLSKGSQKRDIRLVSALGAMFMVVSLTPIGQAGIDRARSVFDPGDANVAYRFDKTQEAFETDGYTLITGRGVGLVETPALDPGTQIKRGDSHDSYATMVQRGGILGLALIVVPLIGALYKIWRKPGGIVGVFFGLSVFGLVMAAGNVVLESSYYGIWVWVPLILGVKLAQATPNEVSTVV